MKAAIFEFEGEQLTVKQIRQRVTALSEKTIRDKLAKGMKTRGAMLSAHPKRHKPTSRQQFMIGKPNSQRQRITSSSVFK